MHTKKETLEMGIVRDAPKMPEFDWNLVYQIKPRQFWGIVAGCSVFTVTIGVVIYLLYASGTLSSFMEEMKQSLEQSKDKKSDGRVPDLFGAVPPGDQSKDHTIPSSDVSVQLASQPELYDHLIAASNSLPLRPDPTPLELVRGKMTLLRPFVATTDVEHLLQACNGSARFGESAYDPARIWGWMDDMLLTINTLEEKDGSGSSKTSRLLRWPSHSKSTFLSVFKDDATFSNGRHMVIIDAILKKPVGMLSLVDNSPKNLTVRIDNLWLTPAFQGKKYAHDALLIILKWLFETACYRRVTVEVNHRNVIMRKFVERCGFILETILRKHKIVQRRNCDTALYVMVNSDWTQNEVKIKTLLGIEMKPKMKQAGELDFGIKRSALYNAVESKAVESKAVAVDSKVAGESNEGKRETDTNAQTLKLKSLLGIGKINQEGKGKREGDADGQEEGEEESEAKGVDSLSLSLPIQGDGNSAGAATNKKKKKKKKKKKNNNKNKSSLSTHETNDSDDESEEDDSD